MMRSSMLWAAAALCLTAAVSASAAAPAPAERSTRPPNVVVILADDQGWGDLSVHGNTNLQTPNIDSMAKAGARFDRFFVCPVCAPTRANFLTGRYHLRAGVTGVSRGAERMDLSETTIADVFKAAGYATGAFGKWHNGSQYPYHPNGRGFDEFYGFLSGHWANYFDTTLDHNGQTVRSHGYITDDLTDKAMGFIDQNARRPFFCYVAYNTPHSPFQVPDEYWTRVTPDSITMHNRDPRLEQPDKTRCALAMCENIDYNVGRILAKIDSFNLANDTIVAYFSDNGPNSWRWNDGMSGRKGSVEEGGVRVPFLIRWPGHIRSGAVVPQIAGAIDLLPTLADLAGIPSISPKPLDGVSLKPLLEGDGKAWPDRMIFVSTSGKKISVRTQQYRDDGKDLYDMQADPGQRHSLSREKPELHKEFADAIRAWKADVMPAPVSLKPCPVGYPEFPLTVLPAQDCRWDGKGLRFSAGPPNSSWLTNWTRVELSPYWDVDVHTAGRYKASVLYTCPKENVGAELELSFQDRAVRATVTEPYDPPLIPSPDRVKRGESYEKPFRALELGVIELPKGRGRLALRALSMPGKAVIDMRAVNLELLK